MHGAVIPVSPEKLWDFSYLTAGDDQTIIVARALNTTPFTTLSIFVRCHSNKIAGTTDPKIDVIVRNIYPSPTDPTIFTPTTTLLTATINGNTSDGDVVEATNTTLVGPWVSVMVQGTQATPVTTLAASLSFGLLGRVN